MKTCVECGDHVASYVQVPLCEECFKRLLNEKLKED